MYLQIQTYYTTNHHPWNQPLIWIPFLSPTDDWANLSKMTKHFMLETYSYLIHVTFHWVRPIPACHFWFCFPLSWSISAGGYNSATIRTDMIQPPRGSLQWWTCDENLGGLNGKNTSRKIMGKPKQKQVSISTNHGKKISIWFFCTLCFFR